MDDFYLNDSKRKFYKDALEHVRSCEDDFWDLDKSLDKHIDQINLSFNVRTMYSRRGKNRSGTGLESYFTICYTKDVENKIKNEIETRLNIAFNNNRYCTFVAYYNPPRIEIDNEEAAHYLKYITHSDYWNVFNVKFELKGGFADEHDNFWNILSEILFKI